MTAFLGSSGQTLLILPSICPPAISRMRSAALLAAYSVHSALQVFLWAFCCLSPNVALKHYCSFVAAQLCAVAEHSFAAAAGCPDRLRAGCFDREHCCRIVWIPDQQSRLSNRCRPFGWTHRAVADTVCPGHQDLSCSCFFRPCSDRLIAASCFLFLLHYYKPLEMPCQIKTQFFIAFSPNWEFNKQNNSLYITVVLFINNLHNILLWYVTKLKQIVS